MQNDKGPLLLAGIAAASLLVWNLRRRPSVPANAVERDTLHLQTLSAGVPFHGWEVPRDDYAAIVAAADEFGVPRELMLATGALESAPHWSAARGDNCHNRALNLPCNGTDDSGNCSFGLFQAQRCNGLGSGHAISDLLNANYNARLAAGKMRSLYVARGSNSWNVLFPTWSVGYDAYAIYQATRGTAAPAAPPPPPQPAVRLGPMLLSLPVDNGIWSARPGQQFTGTVNLINPTRIPLTYHVTLVWLGAADGSSYYQYDITAQADEAVNFGFTLIAPGVVDVYSAYLGVSVGNATLVDPGIPEAGNWTLQVASEVAPQIGPGYSVAPGGCRFVFGFATMHDLLPSQVGTCLENEHVDPVSGDTVQSTTGGLLVWRAADSVVAFTNGYETWINGPYGLQHRLNTEKFSWE